MKMRYGKTKPKIFFCAAVCFCMLLSMVGTTADTVQQDSVDYTTPTASYTICGLKGDSVAFSATSLEEKLNISSETLSGIIVTDLPDPSDGVLKINGEAVQLFETIGRDGINRLTFVPAKGSTGGKFCFVPLVPDEEEECSEMTIALLDTMNTSPSATATTISTQENITVQGALKVTDEDDSTVKIVITQQPQKGSITVDGLNYTYEPYAGKTGTDSFTYKAVDKYGYASDAVTVGISISKPKSDFSYADMSGDANYYAALQLVDDGIMTGQKIGGSYYFEPQQKVTKGDFLMMLLAVTGRDGSLTATVNTGLGNDTEIPMWLKPYVACALRLGIIGGKVCSSSFNYKESVTMTQAVYMIDNSVMIPDAAVSASVFEDISKIPSWALQSYVNLYSNDILSLDNGCAEPDKKLTRSETAGLLYALKLYCGSHEDALEIN